MKLTKEQYDSWMAEIELADVEHLVELYRMFNRPLEINGKPRTQGRTDRLASRVLERLMHRKAQQSRENSWHDTLRRRTVRL